MSKFTVSLLVCAGALAFCTQTPAKEFNLPDIFGGKNPLEDLNIQINSNGAPHEDPEVLTYDIPRNWKKCSLDNNVLKCQEFPARLEEVENISRIGTVEIRFNAALYGTCTLTEKGNQVSCALGAGSSKPI